MAVLNEVVQRNYRRT